MSRLLIAATLAAGSLAACNPVYDVERSRAAAMRFDAELAGLAAGPSRSCLPPRTQANVVAARDGVLLFRDGRTVYANQTSGGCEDIADMQYALVTENFGSGGLCRGSLAKVVDLTSGGLLRGTCILGDFRAYRRP